MDDGPGRELLPVFTCFYDHESAHADVDKDEKISKPSMGKDPGAKVFSFLGVALNLQHDQNTDHTDGQINHPHVCTELRRHMLYFQNMSVACREYKRRGLVFSDSVTL